MRWVRGQSRCSRRVFTVTRSPSPSRYADLTVTIKSFWREIGSARVRSAGMLFLVKAVHCGAEDGGLAFRNARKTILAA